MYDMCVSVFVCVLVFVCLLYITECELTELNQEF